MLRVAENPASLETPSFNVFQVEGQWRASGGPVETSMMRYCLMLGVRVPVLPAEVLKKEFTPYEADKNKVDPDEKCIIA